MPGPEPLAPAAVVVARHARTEWNAAGRFQGWADVPLDGVGAAQAAALADQLAVLGPSRVISSDLVRARATAEAVASAAGLSVEVDPDLREVDLGAWEGLTADEAAARWPEEYRAWRAGQDVARGGGETLAAAGRRMAAAVVRAAGGVRRVAPATAVGAAAGVRRVAPATAVGAAAGVRRFDPTTPAQGPAVIVSHGLVIQSGLRHLAARGMVALPEEEIPHLGNARWIETRVRLAGHGPKMPPREEREAAPVPPG